MAQQNCTQPGCPNHGRYWRVCGHGGESFKPLVAPKKESDTQKERLKVYRVEARKFITRNKVCKLKMEGCEKEARCVHHTKGREGDLLLNKAFWLPSCYSCNLQVEIKDKEARVKDLKLSKFNTHATNH